MSREQERQRTRNNSRSSRQHDYLVKLCGVPHSLNKDDIKKFLHPCRIRAIHLANDQSDSNSTSDCLVDLESENDVKDALKKNNQTLENKYIEVLRATIHEYNFFEKHKGMVAWHDPVIRLNGLPFTCTMANVQNFFKGIEIARNGIYITRDMSDTAVGGGYVAFVNMDNAFKAIDLYDQKHIEHRYIELNSSTYDEAKKAISNDAYLNGKRFAGESVENEVVPSTTNGRKTNRTRSPRRSRSNSRDRRNWSAKRRLSPPVSSRSQSRPQSKSVNQRSRNNNSRRSRSRSRLQRSSPVVGRNGEYLLKMRGMPFNVVANDIREFFPSSCQPTRIEIIHDRRANRPNGDGHVYFSSSEAAREAMKCDRKYMGSRYVELYFDSANPSSPERRRSEKRSRSKTKSKSKSRSKSKSKSRSKSVESPPPSSRSSSKSKDNDDLRSRTGSEPELL